KACHRGHNPAPATRAACPAQGPAACARPRGFVHIGFWLTTPRKPGRAHVHRRTAAATNGLAVIHHRQNETAMPGPTRAAPTSLPEPRPACHALFADSGSLAP